MTKTAEQLLKELKKDSTKGHTIAVPMQLVTKTIKAIDQDWVRQTQTTLSADAITVVRLTRRSDNLMDLTYFSEVDKAEKYICIPKGFEFKVPAAKTAKSLQKAYDLYLVKHLGRQLRHYAGSVGCDPEVFAETEAGELIPAFNFLGSKKDPSKGPVIHDGNNDLYWDGFQAEFTTTANGCMGYHSDSIRYGIEGVWTALKKHDPKARLSIRTVFDTPPELLRASKPEHVEFGCMPSFNIYGMEGMKADGYQVFHRAAGGHIHLGCGKLAKDVLERAVKAMDAVLGVACVSLFAKFDDPRRRQMYGLAGEYRLPPHGLEYRVLSNAWLMHPMIANLVFDLARGAFAFGFQDFLKLWDGNEKETVECINNCDVKLARKILKRNKDLFLQIADMKYQDADQHEEKFKLARPLYVWDAVINGAESVIKDPTNIEKNWMLGEKWHTHCGYPTKNVSSNVFGKNNELMPRKKI